MELNYEATRRPTGTSIYNHSITQPETKACFVNELPDLCVGPILMQPRFSCSLGPANEGPGLELLLQLLPPRGTTPEQEPSPPHLDGQGRWVRSEGPAGAGRAGRGCRLSFCIKFSPLQVLRTHFFLKVAEVGGTGLTPASCLVAGRRSTAPTALQQQTAPCSHPGPAPCRTKAPTGLPSPGPSLQPPGRNHCGLQRQEGSAPAALRRAS